VIAITASEAVVFMCFLS